MKQKRLKRLTLIMVIGLVLALAAALVTNVVLTPAITEQDFEYCVTYKLNGETKTLEGVYNCRFEGYGKGENPRDRSYSGEYIVDGQVNQAPTYTIAEAEGVELYIVTLFNDCYLMGDTKDEDYRPFLDEPFLEAMDQEGIQYADTDLPAGFDAEIISWEYPEPIANTFVFSGFSLLHTTSMLAMLAVGLLVIVACMIFVKRDKRVSYKLLDKLSVVLNFVVCFVAIPYITVMTLLLQITMSSYEFLYQAFQCMPAFTAFTVAASVALRRKGYTKAGFFVQFAGPVLFMLPVILDLIG